MTALPMLVLAGGFGTRLRGVVADVPKPMADANGSPFLLHLLENWAAQGADDFVLLVHHQADVIESFVAGSAAALLRDCRIRTVTERVPLGTGGAIANAVRALGIRGSFLVANADTWLGGGVSAVAASPWPAMAVVQVDDTGRYGSVHVRGGLVTAFAEKQRSAGRGWINAGLYHLHADAFDSWDGQPFSVEGGKFPEWARDARLGAVPVDASFVDIGIPDDYFRFCRWAESGKQGAL